METFCCARVHAMYCWDDGTHGFNLSAFVAGRDGAAAVEEHLERDGHVDGEVQHLGLEGGAQARRRGEAGDALHERAALDVGVADVHLVPEDVHARAELQRVDGALVRRRRRRRGRWRRRRRAPLPLPASGCRRRASADDGDRREGDRRDGDRWQGDGRQGD